MAAVNRVMLLGRVVAAPRPGAGTAGGCVLFSVSTEGAGQDDAGQRHRVRVTGDQAAWCLARLRRGMLVHVEGELVACAHGGEAGAVVAAWPAAHLAAHLAVRLEAPLSGARRMRREDRPVAAVPEVPWGHGMDAAGDVPGRPSRRMH